MEKSEFRVLIKYYFLQGKSIKEPEEKLARYYKESAPSHGIVHKWFTEFRCSRISTSDAERPGRQKEVASQEMIDKIHDMVLNNRRLKVREISETVNVSVGRVWYILHECLGMSKLSTRWVLRLLTADHKSEIVWLLDWAWRNSLFPWFCFINEKLNSTGCKKFSNQRTDLKLSISTDIRWYSLRVVTYLQ